MQTRGAPEADVVHHLQGPAGRLRARAAAGHWYQWTVVHGGNLLYIGYGPVDTLAVLVDGQGRWRPVDFDGHDFLSSAVFLQPDGTWLTGATAW